ncbi:MAG: PepSY domain-containing protein, partial [Pseudomonadales bacterium]|nr:PepSY domain-containing protein [Pseudomonadales bacterium]
DIRELPAGNVFLTWMFPLHNGDALGLPGRLLVFFSGLLMAGLFATGVYMWVKKSPLFAGRRSKPVGLSESPS